MFVKVRVDLTVPKWNVFYLSVLVSSTGRHRMARKEPDSETRSCHLLLGWSSYHAEYAGLCELVHRGCSSAWKKCQVNGSSLLKSVASCCWLITFMTGALSYWEWVYTQSLQIDNVVSTVVNAFCAFFPQNKIKREIALWCFSGILNVTRSEVSAIYTKLNSFFSLSTM